VEGRNLTIERRYAEGRAERFHDIAAELVRLKVDIIVVVTTPAALALKRATTTIPIVFPNAINPVETGVVASLGHPGGNGARGAQRETPGDPQGGDPCPGARRGALEWRQSRARPGLARDAGRGAGAGRDARAARAAQRAGPRGRLCRDDATAPRRVHRPAGC